MALRAGSLTFLVRYNTAALLCALLLAGCQPAMTTPTMQLPGEHSASEDATDRWRLKFKAHYFGAFSYSTYGCKVFYRGRPQLNEPDDELQIASDQVPNYLGNLNASWGPIKNFPPPAKVTWRSKDGVPHEAEVDIGVIFKDELIRHNLHKDEITANTLASDHAPGIILEVNDRTINVYMRAHLSTRELQEPGNRYSGFRNDLIKVYSRTY